MTTGTDQVPESATATPSRPTFVPSKSFGGSLSIPTLLLWALILAYILFFSAYSLQRHATFNTFAADLSYIDQPMWNTLQGRFLERTMGDRQVPRVAEHFEPIIIPIALVFYLWDDVRALLIIQTVALALGALPVYWIAKEQISRLGVGGRALATRRGELALRQTIPLAFVLVYLMFPALQAANLADFHADPFVVTPLLFAFWYASRGRYRAMWAWAVAAMLVKENLPTLTFMLGLYLLFGQGLGDQGSGNQGSGIRGSGNQGSGIGGSGNQGSARPGSAARAGGIRESGDQEVAPPNSLMPDPSDPDPLTPNPLIPDSLMPDPSDPDSLSPDSPLTRRRLHGLALMAVSLAWFYVATFVIVAPLARQVYGTDGPIYLASRYASFSGGLSGVLTQLRDTLALLREPDRLAYLAGLFASVGWLALLAPEYLLLGLPVLAANTFSNFPGQYSGEQHYSAPLAPVFVIAAIYGFQRLIAGGQRLGVVDRDRRDAPSGSLWDTTLVILAWLLAWCLGYQYLRGWTPIARDFGWPERTAHHLLLARFAGQVPPDASLSTTPPLHPHLAHREKIYVFPTVADAEFVLVDVSGRTDAHPNDVWTTIHGLIESGDFGLVDAADGYILLGRGYKAGMDGKLPDAFYDFARASEVRPQYPAQVDFENKLRLLGYDLIDDPKWRQTYLRLYWQALAPLGEDLVLWPFIFSEDGALIEDTSQRLMVAPLWYPPSRWRVGEVVITEMLAWDLGPRFNVGVAALRGAPGNDPTGLFADPAARLPVTSASREVTLFHAGSWAQLGAYARHGRYLTPVTGGPDLLPLEASFAEGVHLAGYRVSQRGSQVSVVLRWQPAAEISRDYTVFVHLVAPDGTVVSQSDARPNWVVPWPTNRWLPGWSVLDGHQLVVPAEASPGPYRLQVGLYQWETMKRLSVLDEAMQPAGDTVALPALTVEP